MASKDQLPILRIKSWEKYTLSRQTVSKYRKDGLLWIPVYVDSWLMGSIHFELEPGEQATFLDFILLAAKDNGYIRANETTPYTLRFLAGYLNKSEELVKRTIDKCLQSQVDKLEAIALRNCQGSLQDCQEGSEKCLPRVEYSRVKKSKVKDEAKASEGDKPPLSPEHKTFVAKWFEFYQNEVGTKPRFSKKEGQQVKDLILSRIDGKKITLEVILDWLERYFTDKDYELTKKNGYTIGGFNRWVESGLAGG